jgi:hypothetical protein
MTYIVLEIAIPIIRMTREMLQKKGSIEPAGKK